MARFGSLGTQYFDDAGDPLVNGKIYFFESGTNTPKDTFADVNLSIPNANPVLLSASGRQPSVFFSGVARGVITKNDDTQIEVRDPLGGEQSEGSFSDWNSLTIYNKPDIVVGSDGKFYISITDGNQGNDPTGDLINWSEIKLVAIWNPNQTYAFNDPAIGPDGYMYISITASNLNNNPVSDATNWKTASPSINQNGVVFSAAKVFAFRSL
jgi:hypothetical protein